MTQVLSDVQRATLVAFCDTVVAPIEREPDPHGLWRTSASDVGVPEAFEGLIATFPEEQVAGVTQLLDALEAQGFSSKSQRSREQLLRNMQYLGTEVALGVGGLVAAVLYLSYGLPDQTGQNPFWKAFGFPGPAGLPPEGPRHITPVAPADGAVLEADVVVVGSGAGGGVIAGTLAQRGLKVVVLEAGEPAEEPDFQGLELPAFQRFYWRGGPTPTADGNVTLQAGFVLGGGTSINWTNCLRTKPWVREQWAAEFGLEGVDGPDFDGHLDHVLGRISATDELSDLNGPHERMREGAEALGWSFKKVVRNASREGYDPHAAGLLGFGDQTGSKQTTTKTFLADAVAHGAEVVCRAWAHRVLVEGGRAAGVEASLVDPATGAATSFTVRAKQVVVAAGALESPALLLRSGIGGPAVGRHLRLHPCTAIFGAYADEQRAWWGPPHAALVDEFADLGDGYGFLIEGVQYTTGLTASALPWLGAAHHKSVMEQVPNGVTFIPLLRDHGGGQVTIDDGGQAVPWYSLDDPKDVRNAYEGIRRVVELHVAAGAQEIRGLAAGMPLWRRGDDVRSYVDKLQSIPLRAGGHRVFAAHQMGTCRMGLDPQDSVAKPDGELHDTPGVWIGDTSAFPTASGTNPMVTCMALAHRTAGFVASAAGAKAVAEVA